MRKRIYEIIEVAESEDKLSKAYDIFMILCILVSLFPLMFKEQTTTMGYENVSKLQMHQTKQ